MIQSMTAFSRMQTKCDEVSFCWEIKSVNHRYFDVSFRMPESWRFLETELRTIIRSQIYRGKLECQLKLSEIMTNPSVVVNDGLINSLLDMTDKLAKAKQLQNDTTISWLLNWPGVVTIVEADNELFTKQIVNLFQSTIAQLQSLRTLEGEALKNQIQSRLYRLQEEITKAKDIVLAATSFTRNKLLTRLHSMSLTVDNARIEQEIALILLKMDVSEELDRLDLHAKEVASVLTSTEAASGRRLDFLMQELNREANTLSSKSDLHALTQSAVEMKVLIEQMREQIQNLE